MSGAGQASKKAVGSRESRRPELGLARVLGQECGAGWRWVSRRGMGQPWKALEAELGFDQVIGS